MRRQRVAFQFTYLILTAFPSESTAIDLFISTNKPIGRCRRNTVANFTVATPIFAKISGLGLPRAGVMLLTQ
jgi:hypothetical protein